MPQTMFEKIWSEHVISKRSDGTYLLYVDCHLLHEGSRFAFDTLRRKGLAVLRPEQTFAVADHFVPTETLGRNRGLDGIENPEIRSVVEQIERNTSEMGVALFGLGHEHQGIVHVVGPELGLTQPGTLLVCGDSHTSTHGALGALAFGIGHTENAHVLATQSIWQRKPKVMAIEVNGDLPRGTFGKDLVLSIIARIGAAGATGHAVEYRGSTFEALSVEQRMTVCNMAIESGARAGMIAADDKTFDYLKGKPFAPAGEHWDRAVEKWKSYRSDPDAKFDTHVSLDAADIEPTVTWGTSPDDAIGISGHVPDPADQPSPAAREKMRKALAYMGLRAGMKAVDIVVDKVFIGSCTNSRIEDLRQAAEIARGRKAVIPAMVVPGSQAVNRQAREEGLDKILVEAGFDWREPGCSMCIGVNGDLLEPHERCASTSNRNFEGRQGKDARTHLMSAPMAAAAAVTGRISDVRELL